MVIALGAAAIIGTGCRSIEIQPVRTITVAGSVEPFIDGRIASFAGEPGRLADDVPRAIKRSHWGMIRIDQVSNEQANSAGETTTMTIVRADALLPDGRTAQIVAWGSGQDRVTAAIRMVRFGDAAEHDRYLNTLAQVLDGKPKRVRAGTFDLPPTAHATSDPLPTEVPGQR